MSYTVPQLFNVKSAPFNATGDGVTNDWAAIDAAMAAVAQVNADLPSVGASLYFPAGNYYIGANTIWSRANNARYYGDGPLATVFTTNSNSGPMWINSIDYGTTAGHSSWITTNLATGGSTNAIRMHGQNPDLGWYNLSDDVNIRGALNGLGTLTCRFYFKPLVDNAGTGIIFCSRGANPQYGAQTQAMCLSVGAHNLLSWDLNLGGTIKTVTVPGGTFTANTTYFVACVYDGSAMKIYVGAPGGSTGSAVATTAASGTIQQGAWEEMTLGAQLQAWPDSNIANGGHDCVLDSFNIDKRGNLYTGSFTAPTAKLASTFGQTIVLLNADAYVGQSMQGTNINQGGSWFMFRPNSGPAGALNSVTFENFGLYGNGTAAGLWSISTVRGCYKDIQMQQLQGAALYVWQNVFETRIKRFYATLAAPIVGASTVPAAMMLSVQGGLSTIADCVVQGGRIQYFTLGSSVTLTDCAAVPESDVVTPFVCIDDSGGGNIDLINCSADIETGVPNLTSVMRFSGLQQTAVLGCNLSTGANNVPSVIIEGYNSTFESAHAFTGCMFSNGNNSGAFVQVGSTAVRGAVTFSGCSLQQSTKSPLCSGIPFRVI